MSCLILNGSPRGKSSNSAVITQWFVDGVDRASGLTGITNEKTLNQSPHATVEVLYLNKVNHHEAYAKKALESTHLVMVFPLYVDGMPAQVKQFIEVLAPLKSSLYQKKITFIIHSGFSEGIQNRTLESYLNRFAQKMGLTNAGVIVIPGSEGFRLMPPKMTRKKHDAVMRLGQAFKAGTPYSSEDLNQLRGKETTSKFGALLFKILSKTGLTNLYWNSLLKQNNAFSKRFDQPYLQKK